MGQARLRGTREERIKEAAMKVGDNVSHDPKRGTESVLNKLLRTGFESKSYRMIQSSRITKITKSR